MKGRVHKNADIEVPAEDLVIPELEAAPGPVRVGWTDRETAILRKYFPRTDTGALAKYLHRDLNSIRSKAQSLGLRKAKGVREDR